MSLRGEAVLLAYSPVRAQSIDHAVVRCMSVCPSCLPIIIYRVSCLCEYMSAVEYSVDVKIGYIKMKVLIVFYLKNAVCLPTKQNIGKNNLYRIFFSS